MYKAPKRISFRIAQLAADLVPGGVLQYVPALSNPLAVPKECFHATAEQVRTNGGTTVYGWRIWENPTILVEAEFHAVWKDGQGHLYDVAGLPNGEDKILFVVDEKLRYEGRQRNNVRKPLRTSPEVSALIAAWDAEFELLNRGERAYQHGEIALAGLEARQMEEIQKTKLRTEITLKAQFTLPGRNDPCHCGSGRKFKKCCA